MIIIMGCVCFDEECASVLLLVMNRLPLSLSPFLSHTHTHTHTYMYSYPFSEDAKVHNKYMEKR